MAHHSPARTAVTTGAAMNRIQNHPTPTPAMTYTGSGEGGSK